MTTPRIRGITLFFVLALVTSGMTAFPIVATLQALEPLFGAGGLLERLWPALALWLVTVLDAYERTYEAYPFIGYGTDWLAFAHLVIAGAFWGVWRDPVRNIFVVEWAMAACIGIFPLALICGPLRGIPWFWTIVDCGFGIVGFPVLWWLRREILALEDRLGRRCNCASSPAASGPTRSPGASPAESRSPTPGGAATR